MKSGFSLLGSKSELRKQSATSVRYWVSQHHDYLCQKAGLQFDEDPSFKRTVITSTRMSGLGQPVCVYLIRLCAYSRQTLHNFASHQKLTTSHMVDREQGIGYSVKVPVTITEHAVISPCSYDLANEQVEGLPIDEDQFEDKVSDLSVV